MSMSEQGRERASGKRRFRIAIPAWGWGSPLFGTSPPEEALSREEMMRLFGKELETPALMPRRATRATP